MKKSIWVYGLVIAILVSFNSPWANAVGVRTRFGVVVVENLQPGRTYNIRELVGLPLKVVNTSDKQVTIKMDIQKPDPETDKGMAAKHFEPIPDLSWIKLSKDFFVVDPGHAAVADVLVTIPDDDKYLGKRYQVNIWSRTIGKRFANVGVMSNLRITIAKRRMTEEEKLAEAHREEIIKNIDFQLLPHTIFIDGVELGKKIDIEKKYKNTLKVVNPNNEKFSYRIKTVTAWEAEMGVIPGYEETPALSFLTFSEKEFSVSPISIRQIKMFLQIPDEEKYRGKKYQFVISVQVLNQPIIYEIYSRLFISTVK